MRRSTRRQRAADRAKSQRRLATAAEVNKAASENYSQPSELITFYVRTPQQCVFRARTITIATTSPFHGFSHHTNTSYADREREKEKVKQGKNKRGTKPIHIDTPRKARPIVRSFVPVSFPSLHTYLIQSVPKPSRFISRCVVVVYSSTVSREDRPEVSKDSTIEWRESRRAPAWNLARLPSRSLPCTTSRPRLPSFSRAIP